jgi:hypothetical protein
MGIDIGTSATVTFATSGFTACIRDISVSGISREAVETTCMDTSNARTFIPGDLYDPGEVSMEILFNPDTDLPLNGAAEVITITYPLGTGETSAATLAGTGFLTAVDWTVPLEDVMTASVTFKFTGELTFNDAA